MPQVYLRQEVYNKLLLKLKDAEKIPDFVNEAVLEKLEKIDEEKKK